MHSDKDLWEFVKYDVRYMKVENKVPSLFIIQNNVIFLKKS